MLEYGKAICYSGYRKNQSPNTKVYPTLDEIKEDLEILNSLGFKYLRMYDPVVYVENVCKVIRENKYDMQLMVGPGLICEVNNHGCPWFKSDYSDEELAQRAKRNDQRIEDLIRIANENADIINVVSVGNENTPSWGENNVPVSRLIEFAKRLKAGTGKPVTFNEGCFEWDKLKDLAEHLDIISVHSYPLWNRLTVDQALDANKHWYEEVKKMYPNKQVLFSEVGWATKACDFSQMIEGEPTEEKQVAYYEGFLKWMNEEKVISYLFEAFDEPWKGSDNPDEVEKHWGLYYEDRTPKPVMKLF